MSLSVPQYAAAKEVFHRSLAVPASERAALVEQACGADSEVKAEVLSLLGFHDGSGGESAAYTPVHIARDGSRVGSVTRLLRRIALDPRRRLALMTIAVLAIVAAGELGRRALARSLTDELRGHLTSILAADVLALDVWTDHRLDEVRHWATDPRVQTLAAELESIAHAEDEPTAALNASPALAELRRVLSGAMRSGLYEHFAIVNLDYVSIASDWGAFVGKRLVSGSDAMLGIARTRQNREAFMPRLAFGSSVAVDARERMPKRSFSWFGAPVLDTQGHPFGGLTLAVDASKNFDRILRVGRWGESGETYAFDRHGRLLSSSRFDAMLVGAGMLAEGQESPGTLELRDPGGDLTAGFQHRGPRQELPFTRGVARALAAAEDPTLPNEGAILEPYRDYRGIDVIGAWHWNAELEYGVITEIDAREALGPARAIGLGFAVVSGALAVALLVAFATSLAVLRLAPTARLGARMGQYKLLRKIGEGGIGEVYLAKHELLKRPTAIKILRRDVADADSDARFELEVRATARLSHPNTVAIYDFGRTEAGRFYYAMEYLVGISLARLIELEGALPLARVVFLVRQIAGSLGEAHALGYVHRDVKPLNIMICRVGGELDVVKVLDFGLVKNLKPLAVDEVTRALPHSLRGTPSYMAPELVRDPTKVTPLADVYSLAVVTYKLLAARNPFEAAHDVALLYDILNSPPRPLAEARPDLPPAVTSLIMSALSKNPDHRPLSMAAYAAALTTAAGAAGSGWGPAEAQAWWSARDHLLADA